MPFATVTPDRDGTYSLKLPTLGLFITAGVDDDGQPYVSVNTEDMPPEHVYDEATGLPGTARPYSYEEEAGGSAVVLGPLPDLDGAPRVVARHFGEQGWQARLAAKHHADLLNGEWAKRCGMPILSVHLNDAELYDARDHNPALREEIVDAVPDGELSNHNDLADFRVEEEKTDA
jgi:hypothetical protein